MGPLNFPPPSLLVWCRKNKARVMLSVTFLFPGVLCSTRPFVCQPTHNPKTGFNGIPCLEGNCDTTTCCVRMHDGRRLENITVAGWLSSCFLHFSRIWMFSTSFFQSTAKTCDNLDGESVETFPCNSAKGWIRKDKYSGTPCDATTGLCSDDICCHRIANQNSNFLVLPTSRLASCRHDTYTHCSPLNLLALKRATGCIPSYFYIVNCFFCSSVLLGRPQTPLSSAEVMCSNGAVDGDGKLTNQRWSCGEGWNERVDFDDTTCADGKCTQDLCCISRHPVSCLSAYVCDAC